MTSPRAIPTRKQLPGFMQASATAQSSRDDTYTTSSRPSTVRAPSNRSPANQPARRQGERRPTASSSERQGPSSTRRPSSSLHDRRQSNSSTSNSGSAAAGPPRSSGRPVLDMSPTSSVSSESNSSADKIRVTFKWKEAKQPLNLDCNWNGEQLYLFLDQRLRRIKLILDRNLHFLRFGLGPSLEDFYIVSLLEDEVSDNWTDVVQWIKSSRDSGVNNFFAMIDQDEDVH